jgi:hypothetical protein
VAIATACVGTAALGCPAERSYAEVAEHIVPRLPRSARLDKASACVVAGLCPAGRSPVTMLSRLPLHGSCS